MLPKKWRADFFVDNFSICQDWIWWIIGVDSHGLILFWGVWGWIEMVSCRFLDVMAGRWPRPSYLIKRSSCMQKNLPCPFTSQERTKSSGTIWQYAGRGGKGRGKGVARQNQSRDSLHMILHMNQPHFCPDKWMWYSADLARIFTLIPSRVRGIRSNDAAIEMVLRYEWMNPICSPDIEPKFYLSIKLPNIFEHRFLFKILEKPKDRWQMALIFFWNSGSQLPNAPRSTNGTNSPRMIARNWRRQWILAVQRLLQWSFLSNIGISWTVDIPKHGIIPREDMTCEMRYISRSCCHWFEDFSRHPALWMSSLGLWSLGGWRKVQRAQWAPCRDQCCR